MHSSKVSGRPLTETARRKVLGTLQKDAAAAPPPVGNTRILEDGTVRVLEDNITTRILE